MLPGSRRAVQRLDLSGGVEIFDRQRHRSVLGDPSSSSEEKWNKSFQCLNNRTKRLPSWRFSLLRDPWFSRRCHEPEAADGGGSAVLLLIVYLNTMLPRCERASLACRVSRSSLVRSPYANSCDAGVARPGLPGPSISLRIDVRRNEQSARSALSISST
jgi:hypothetical protein